jgi:hypothetical protein
MKNLNLISLSVIASLLLSFTVLQINTNTLFVESYEDIGIIKQSVLKPESFNKTQKGVWVLLDGRELEPNTQLYKILEEGHDLNILKNGKNLPDALGKFIRSSNYLGKGIDPDTSRLVGSTQLDAFQGHKHIGSDKIAENLGRESPNTPKQRQNVTGTNLKETSGTLDAGQGLPRVSSETRPVNITMYTYIKVSK